jgi:hypothetical protein
MAMTERTDVECALAMEYNVSPDLTTWRLWIVFLVAALAVPCRCWLRTRPCFAAVLAEDFDATAKNERGNPRSQQAQQMAVMAALLDNSILKGGLL